MVSLDRGNRATSKPANLISQAVARGGFRITHAQTEHDRTPRGANTGRLALLRYLIEERGASFGPDTFGR